MEFLDQYSWYGPAEFNVHSTMWLDDSVELTDDDIAAYFQYVVQRDPLMSHAFNEQTKTEGKAHGQQSVQSKTNGKRCNMSTPTHPKRPQSRRQIYSDGDIDDSSSDSENDSHPRKSTVSGARQMNRPYESSSDESTSDDDDVDELDMKSMKIDDDDNDMVAALIQYKQSVMDYMRLVDEFLPKFVVTTKSKFERLKASPMMIFPKDRNPMGERTLRLGDYRFVDNRSDKNYINELLQKKPDQQWLVLTIGDGKRESKSPPSRSQAKGKRITGEY